MKPETLSFLDGLCAASGMIWTEAGMGYDYCVRHKTAHQNAPEVFRVHWYSSGDTITFEPTEDQLSKLARFFRGAFGDASNSTLVMRQVDEARNILKKLHDDIAFDMLHVETSEDAYGMAASLKMLILETKTLVELQLSWQID